ncbi:hypothetical protein J7337_001668 [Fusarium musae]|uniref:Uncharacterized protein n=1 Tax=Fusarium musae TaxID=1042133 RepID=A0A9P8DU18_9HYPO|nr:hypothetical protein J7337_001668 [Fusarium musae]KAG9508108.1 hypothetical protein J7337_001668 [Fusarium musae]
MDLEFEDHDFIDSSSGSDDPDTAYHKENSGLSPSCGLCRFDFCVDDSVVVCKLPFPFHNYGSLLTLFTVKQKCEPWTTTYPKPESWWSIADAQHTFHAECVDLSQCLLSGQRLDPGIYDATILEPWEEGRHPPPSFKARRLNWLKRSFSRNLAQTINYSLPHVACDIIAQYCLKERAVQVVRDLWLRQDRPKPGRISVAIDGSSLWAQYVEFEGIRYVRSLSYHSLGGDESQILPEPDPGRNVNIFIAHSYHGVTEIIATSDNDIPSVKEETGRWWTLFTPSEMPFYLKAIFDGIKLRDLAAYKYAKGCPKYPDELRWSVLPTTMDPIPEPPIPCSSWLDGDIISAIDWNQPGITGYSFYVRDNTIMKIIPHKDGEKNSYDFATPKQYQFSWVYFPVDSGERISEVWIRRYGVKRLNTRASPVATLILRTSNGRLLTLGPQLKYRQPSGYNTHAKYDLVGTMPQKHPCRMYFANWEDIGSWMRFEGASTFAELDLAGSQDKALELLPDNCKYQYSSAELEGVRTVTPCRSWRHYSPDAILGLLLTYEDGRKRCVGQVRLDHLLTPIEVTSDTMWIVCSEKDEISWRADEKEDGSGVDLVTFEEPDAKDSHGQCIKIPMRGRLDWYSSHHQCHLSHRDDSEPVEEVLEVLSQEAAPGMPRPGHVVKPLSVLVGKGVRSMENWEFERRQWH